VLTAAFPSTLDQYDANGIQQITFETSLPFDVVCLAREAGIHCILPAAYYRYCEIFAEDGVLEGITRPDGTLSTLSVQDQRAVMKGWHRLLQKQPSNTFQWMMFELEDDREWFTACEARKPGCTFARKDLLCKFYPMESECRALQSWDPNWEVDMCSPCAELCKITHAHGRATIWEKLPSVFGLPNWDKL
jgi:hypothetical protein